MHSAVNSSIVVSLVVVAAAAFCPLHCRRLYLFVVCRIVCWTSEKSIALGRHREWDSKIPVNFVLSFQIKQQQKQQLSQSTQWICEWKSRGREEERNKKLANNAFCHCLLPHFVRPVVISRHMAGLIKFASLQWQSRISLVSTRSRT